jgi:hypothetical protein
MARHNTVVGFGQARGGTHAVTESISAVGQFTYDHLSTNFVDKLLP